MLVDTIKTKQTEVTHGFSLIRRQKMNKVQNIQDRGIEIIKDKGFQVQDFTGTEEDFGGVDIIVSDDSGRSKKVDIKVDSTLSEIFYPTEGYTGLISLMHHKGDGIWKLPKYLERNDVYV